MKDTANHWYPKVKCASVILFSLKNLPGGKESSGNFLHHNNENLALGCGEKITIVSLIISFKPEIKRF